MQVPAVGHRQAAPAQSAIRVVAPARLHFGFIDLHGGLGRRFGSLGLAIEHPALRLHASHDACMQAEGPSRERVLLVMQSMVARYHLDARVRIEVEESIPEHAGLGSGTQLALATAAALCALSARSYPVAELARSMHRGARSGIGSGVFELGGFVVDGGRGAREAAPPVISRLPFPEHWRVVLLFDFQMTGLHGEREVAAFRELPRFPERQAERLARLVLMQLLPALAEGHIEAFGAALSDLQRTVGDHFAPAQGGRYTSRRVEQALEVLDAQGAAAVGQSSWGPTGFALFGSQHSAEEAVQRLRAHSSHADALAIQVTRGCNHGATVQPDYTWNRDTSCIS